MNKVKRYLINLLKKSRTQQGFTLIEMVVVVAIIVLLVLIIAPNLMKQKKNADTKTSDAFKSTLQTQVDLYKDEKKLDGKVDFTTLHKDKYLTDDQFKKSANYDVNDDGEVIAKSSSAK